MVRFLQYFSKIDFSVQKSSKNRKIWAKIGIFHFSQFKKLVTEKNDSLFESGALIGQFTWLHVCDKQFKRRAHFFCHQNLRERTQRSALFEKKRLKKFKKKF